MDNNLGGQSFPAPTFQMKPSLERSFQTSKIKEVCTQVLSETLTGKTYDPAKAAEWTSHLSNQICIRLKDLAMLDYKHIVQVFLGQAAGAGCKLIARCRWDAETDNYTSATFTSTTIFASVIVFGIYMY